MSDINKFEELSDDFTKATKRILKTKVTQNQGTLNEIRDNVVETFNELTTYAAQIYDSQTNQNRKLLIEKITRRREKLAQSLVALGYETKNLPTEIGQTLELLTTEIETDEHSDQGIITEQELDLEERLSIDSEEVGTEANMTEMTRNEFDKATSATLNYHFAGDPLKLQSFIDALHLLEGRAANDEQKRYLVSYAIMKLEGTAREAVTVRPTTVEGLINILKEKIRFDNSKVVEGKLQALRSDRTTLQEFTETANKLAEEFRRALVMEGIPSVKAEQMTIEKTIEVCRLNARTDLVKAVLSSTKFDSPKEVTARYVIEIAEIANEKRILAYTGRSRGNGSGQNRGNFNGFYNRGNRNGQRSYGYNNAGSGGNYHNNGYGYNNNYRGSNNGFNNRGGRGGRGSYRGKNNTNIRYAENASAPRKNNSRGRRH